jgi:hypothetical protein
MANDRQMWEAALKEHFEDFLRKVEIAKVPEVLILTFLKAEIKEMENRVQGWIDLSNHL